MRIATSKTRSNSRRRQQPRNIRQRTHVILPAAGSEPPRPAVFTEKLLWTAALHPARTARRSRAEMLLDPHAGVPTTPRSRHRDNAEATLRGVFVEAPLEASATTITRPPVTSLRRRGRRLGQSCLRRWSTPLVRNDSLSHCNDPERGLVTGQRPPQEHVLKETAALTLTNSLVNFIPRRDQHLRRSIQCLREPCQCRRRRTLDAALPARHRCGTDACKTCEPSPAATVVRQ